MRQPLTIAVTVVVVVVAASIATGCGSDDDKGGGGGSDDPKSSAKAAKLKPTSARAQLVKCVKEAGFEITHDDQDAATATNYTVEGDADGSKRAEVVIHPNKEDASRAATKASLNKGLNAVAFGRAEFINLDATNNEAGVLANCVAEGYVR